MEKAANSLTFQKETMAQALAEMLPLFELHWAEIARNKDKIKLDPDIEKYKRLEAVGAAHLFTARYGGAVVGYIVFFLNKHLHYASDLWAISDIFWLSPELRGQGGGKAMFRHAEEWLRGRGVSVIHITSKVANPAARVVLEELGYDLIEYGHAKMLLS